MAQDENEVGLSYHVIGLYKCVATSSELRIALHEPASHEFLESIDISEQCNTPRADIVGLNGPATTSENVAWENGEATFGHLVEGYDAGYYGYLR